MLVEVSIRSTREHLRQEAHFFEGGAVRAQRNLVLGRTVEEIEDPARQPALRHAAQILDVPSPQHPRGRAPRDGAGRGRGLAGDGSCFAHGIHSAFTPDALITRAQRS